MAEAGVDQRPVDDDDGRGAGWPPDTASGVPGTLAPFGHGLYASVWVANTVSNFGGQIQGVGAAWLVTSLTRAPDMVALVTAATLLPILLFSLVSGAIADAFDRRLVLFVAQLIMFTVSTLLAVLTWLGLVTPLVLIALTFLLGCGFALNAPAWQAAVRELVPREQLPHAISLNVLGFNLSRTAGPALGGVVVALGGAQASFVVNALSYLGLFAVLLFWLRRRERRPVRRPEAILPAMRTGMIVCIGSRDLRHLLIRVTLFGLPVGALMALLALVVRGLEGGPASLGLVFGSGGAGAVLGALSANVLRERLGANRMLLLGGLVTAAGIAGVAVSAKVTWIGVAEFCTGFATTVVYMSLNVIVQLRAPAGVLGRALSIHQMGAFGGLALGTWLWGQLATVIAVRPALVCAAVAMVAVTLVAQLFPVRPAPMRERVARIT